VKEPRLRNSPEFDLIGAIRDRLAATARDRGDDVRIGIGDDAAVTVGRGGEATAVTIDAMVDGVAFRRSWCPPRAIGAKAIGAALSDLAAMGATATEAYVWLGMPEDFFREDCLELCDGLAELAERERVAVLGGDITASGILSVCVTAVGRAASADAMVGRSGGSDGDAICVTGTLGGAAAGLMLLEHPELSQGLSERVRTAVTARQLAPRPRLAAGRALSAAGAAAMIDISDGLGAESEHLAAASGVGIEIEVDRVPRGEGVAEVADAAGRDPYELMVGGGEDYELLCAIPRSALAECTDAVTEAGTQLHEIGTVLPGGAVRLRLPGGRSFPASGHDQLRGF
jgi:thiamine-monophosphate kinase